MPGKPERYDLVVIGSGPGGQRAAVQAAKLRKRVLVVEKQAVGGACLHRATIPSKTLREAALQTEIDSEDSLKNVLVRMHKVIEAEALLVAQQLKRNGVEYIQGVGSFASASTIAIDTPEGKRRDVHGDFIVLATGSSPNRPAHVQFNQSTIFDSDTILGIQRQPRTLAVLGAGVIGCEYASIFARMGVKVSLINRPNGILKGVDEEIVQALCDHFSENGVEVRINCQFEEAVCVRGPDGRDGVRIALDGGAQVFDAALYCLGRSGNVSSLNLRAAGLEANDRGLLAVNEHYQTATAHIYAVGDVIGQPALAAVSSEQGRLAAAHAFGLFGGKFPATFPYGIYTIPEISFSGSQEQELKDKNIPYVVGRAEYGELARGKILNEEHGFLKLLVHRETRKILGVHVVGASATELVHIGQIAMDLGANIEFLVNNVFNYPTLAEAYKVAAYNAYNQLYAPAAETAPAPAAAAVVRRR